MCIRKFLAAQRYAALAALVVGLTVFQPVSGLKAGTVLLAWDHSLSTSTIGYNIYFGTASATYTNVVSVGNVTNATVSNLVAGTTYYFAATALDNLGLESDFSSEVVYTVPSANRPPTLNPLPDLTLNENAGLQTVALTGISSGASNETQMLTVTASSSRTTLIPTPGVSYTSPAATGSLSFTPVAYASGTATITVTVNDGGTSNNIVSRSFTVTVNPVLVTGWTAGTLRTNYSGWVGNRFHVGANALVVSALGRIFVSGNTADHALMVVRASDGMTVASATWTPTGGVQNQIKYVDLAAPVTLSANTDYFLVSQEVSGGDSWYSYNTAVGTTADATVLTPIYSNDGTNFMAYGTAGSNSYGPVGLAYCQPTPPSCPPVYLATDWTAGTLRNNYSGWVGNRFHVGASPLVVTALGRIFVSGNTANHALMVVRASDGMTVASATWTPTGGVQNQIKYVDLAAPVTLSASTDYFLVSQEVSGGDSWYSYNTAVGTTADATVLTPIYSNDGTSFVAYGTAGSNTYGPVGVAYCRPSAPPSCPPVYQVTGWTAGTLRNNYSGWVGNRLRVGTNALVVTALGRVFVSGNSANHALMVVQASDGMMVACATWTPTGGVPNQIKYVNLAAPVTLSANADYFLVSQEVSGGDSWYSYNTVVATTADTTVLTPIYSNDGTNFVAYGTAGSNSYGPVAVAYCSAASPACGTPVPWVTAATLGTVRNNYSGWVGNRFRVGATDLRVTALGRIFIFGNSGNHLMQLVRASDGVTVGNAIWTPAGGVHNQIKYIDLAAPVTLSANTDYFLVCREVSGGDQFYSYNTAVSTTTAASVLTPVYSDNGTNWYPYGTAGSNTYGPLGLNYCSGTALALAESLQVYIGNDPPDVASSGETQGAATTVRTATDVTALITGADWGSVGADGHLALEYLRTVPRAAVEYTIEASADGVNWISTDGLVEESVNVVDAGTEYVRLRYLIPADETPVRYLRLQLVPEKSRVEE